MRSLFAYNWYIILKALTDPFLRDATSSVSDMLIELANSITIRKFFQKYNKYSTSPNAIKINRKYVLQHVFFEGHGFSICDCNNNLLIFYLFLYEKFSKKKLFSVLL